MKLLIALVILVLASGCASNRQGPAGSGVIVDTQGVDPVAYQTDLADCEAYAEEVRVGGRVVTGAAAGAVVGGAVGAVSGDRIDTERAAATGAVVGGARGAQGAMTERQRVVRNCMVGRGYRVLN